jgi:hypothetical protein
MLNLKVPPPPITTDDKTVWSSWYLRIRDAINQLRDSLSWVNIDFTGSNITDIKTKRHNDLTNFDGGTVGQFYHLTSAQHTDLTDSGATTLHKHDHNGQDGLQGGTTNEYYHLTYAEWNDLFGTGGGAGSGGARWGGGVDTTDDIIIDSSTSGLVLLDTAGYYWRVTISTAGVLVTTNLGTTKP